MIVIIVSYVIYDMFYIVRSSFEDDKKNNINKKNCVYVGRGEDEVGRYHFLPIQFCTIRDVSFPYTTLPPTVWRI